MTTPTNIIDHTTLLSEIEALKKENEKLKQCKRYGLVWEDHPEALDKKNIIPLLAKDDGLSLPEIADKKQNYLIEGDNYHALKALQHTHRSAIDVIYIDPPYNTGNEFVYNDKIVDKEDSFRHSKWLSFMEKRLKLARELMSDDGVIFISIDDNEQAQLKLLCDAVFGEANFVANIIWDGGLKNNSRFVSVGHDYMLVYSKNIEVLINKDSRWRENKKGLDLFKFFITSINNQSLTVDAKEKLIRKWLKQNTSNIDKGLQNYRYIDNQGVVFRKGDLSAPGGNGATYDIPHPVTGKNVKRPAGGWRYNYKSITELIAQDMIAFGPDESTIPQFKRFLSDDGENDLKVPRSYFWRERAIANSDLQNILGKGVFEYPKDHVVLQRWFGMVSNKDSTILDFFAGSGTTGHAVMELNKEDGGNRNFILCTNNEVSDDLVRTHFFNEGHITKNNKTDFNKFVKEYPDAHQAFLESEAYESLGIARAVTRERIKRVIEGYTTPKGKDVEGLPNNLTYLKTKEFDKKEQYGFDRNLLAKLAFNSHTLKYPELNYESFQVDAFTDIDAIKLTTSKQPVAFVNTRDRESLADIVEQLTSRFGNKVIIETLESYFN